jgi:hypothetical protein
LAVRRHQDQDGRPDRRLAGQIETEVADISAAMPVDHHVIAMKRRERGQVGHHYQAVRILAQQAPVCHRHHQQPPVGQPAQTGWLTGQLEHHLRLAIDADAHYLVRIKIGKPEFAVVPARRLRERQAFCYHGHCGCSVH